MLSVRSVNYSIQFMCHFFFSNRKWWCLNYVSVKDVKRDNVFESTSTLKKHDARKYHDVIIISISSVRVLLHMNTSFVSVLYRISNRHASIHLLIIVRMEKSRFLIALVAIAWENLTRRYAFPAISYFLELGRDLL